MWWAGQDGSQNQTPVTEIPWVFPRVSEPPRVLEDPRRLPTPDCPMHIDANVVMVLNNLAAKPAVDVHSGPKDTAQQRRRRANYELQKAYMPLPSAAADGSARLTSPLFSEVR